MTRPGAVRRVTEWLRAGYPAGVPQQDYVALLALLRRRLTDDEVAEVVERVVLDFPGGDATRADVRRTIEEHVVSEPVPADVSRVSALLAAVGWPLAALEDDDQED